MNDQTPIQRAVDIVGGQSALARAVGVRQGHVWAWLNRQVNTPPLDLCKAIEAATSGAVRCEELRDDVEWERDAQGQVTGYFVKAA